MVAHFLIVCSPKEVVLLLVCNIRGEQKILQKILALYLSRFGEPLLVLCQLLNISILIYSKHGYEHFFLPLAPSFLVQSGSHWLFGEVVPYRSGNPVPNSQTTQGAQVSLRIP